MRRGTEKGVGTTVISKQSTKKGAGWKERMKISFHDFIRYTHLLNMKLNGRIKISKDQGDIQNTLSGCVLT